MEVLDEVSWTEGGLEIWGTVASEPNLMGEFFVTLQDEHGNTHSRTLDALQLPENFVNQTSSLVEPEAGDESSGQPIVITKPQEQSMWPYMAFLVVGGVLILNM